MNENEIAKEIVDVAFEIHTQIGPGLLEGVYRSVMARRLRQRGFRVQEEPWIPVIIDKLSFQKGFRADLIVDEKVIVEVKSVEKLHRAHKKQLLTYLRLTDTRLGLVINFGGSLLRDSISRVVNGLQE